MEPFFHKKYMANAHLNKRNLRKLLYYELNGDDICKENLKKQHYRLLKTAYFYVNQPLITKVTNDFYRNHKDMDYDDLRDQATVALINAFNHFDPDRGWQFSTYAYVVMLNQLRAASKDHDKETNVPLLNQKIYSPISGTIVSIVRIKFIKSIPGIDDIYNITIKSDNQQIEYDYVYNLQVKLGMSIAKGQFLGEKSHFGFKIGHLEQPIGKDNEGHEITQEDNISKSMPDENIVDPNEKLIQLELIERIQKIVKDLPEIEQQILKLKFPALSNHPEKKGLKQKEIGKLLGITQPNVSRHQILAIKAIRKKLANQNIRGDVL